MNTINRTILFCILLIGLSASGCGAGQPLGPTITPPPTNTPTMTLTPTQAPTSTPTIMPTATTSVINGTVIGPDGNPVKNCSLNLNSETSTMIATTKTDTQGKYSFTDVKPGTYSIQYTATILNEKGEIVSITIGNTEKFEVKAGDVVQEDVKLQ